MSHARYRERGDRVLSWAYGLTTVPERRDDLLPRTLASLREAGFDRPRLFVDGADDPAGWSKQFGLDVTSRQPRLLTFGSWLLALWELYLRSPAADRYALFQDDLVAVRNLRAYLERCPCPERWYWNLLTMMDNEAVIRGKPVGWHRSGQRGRGAVALVFSRPAVVTLLQQPHIVERPMAARNSTRNVDGAVIDAMGKAGWQEYIHNPSLVQHVGDRSSMGHPPWPKAVTFREGDALDLLAGRKA